ncbi:CPBP family intramembrane metalloprotease [Desulfonema ishimotonii]|uniref:CPBP family intramembrane metalloprotease n=1 Tax=Desulfonema ishimotonii TaxID=45657 RepID=A0A401FUR5_9BACT|nr:CAAX prenyl protease-related protein [Desulfonema ishimotonii]GBC60711.1 CPBP family intramembrane metalloprotease [Desulfonema ishimotonii]
MTKEPWFGRVLPFGIYMLFILIHDLLLKVLPQGSVTDHLLAFTYPVRIIAVMIALAVFWKSYDEIRRERFEAGKLLTALGAGVLVFVLWISMDWEFAVMGEQDAYDPRTLPGNWAYAFIAVRLFGASVVVPVFEEIFWRSFILRYIVNPDFTTVRIGAFTWSSFLISALLFGAEHNLWLAGIVAGLLYNLLLYRTRHLSYCIIAHGVTNFLLGVYVLQTGHWQFW